MYKVTRCFWPLFMFLTFVFMYAPVLILILFSFNEVAFPYRWQGFSWQWYYELFASSEVWDALKNSLIVAVSAVILSLVMGLFFVFYTAKQPLHRFSSFFYINILLPEVVLAASLLVLFSFCGVPTGLLTLIVGHTVLGLGYALPILSLRFAEIDYSVIEASLDLGASLPQTFVRIVLPLMLPAIVAVGVLVFVISFDDFLIAFFCGGSAVKTLPVYVFAMIRTGISPTINALSTLLLGISSICLVIFCSLKSKIRIV